MAGDAINRSKNARDIMDGLSSSVYQSFLERNDTLGVTDEGELRESGVPQSGEVSFGQVCISGTKRISLHWSRAVYREGELQSFTYCAPEDVEGYYPTLHILPSADGYQVYREAVRVDREGALIVRPLAKFPISLPIAKRVATFVTYACKEEQAHATHEIFDIGEEVRIHGDPVSALINPSGPSRKPPERSLVETPESGSRLDRFRDLLRERQLRIWRRLNY